MDIKLFSLCKQELPAVQAGRKNILDCVKSFSPDCGDFYSFTSQKRMLLAVSQSLRAADVVIVAVQGNMYNATKRLLTAALELKSARNADVTNALRPLLENGKIKKNVFDANIRFPAGSVLLPTESFFHCGFVLTAGGQHIIYLPIESPRADEVVLGSLYDVLSEICEENRSGPAQVHRHSRILSRTAAKLDEESVKIVFSGEGLTKHIEKFAPKSINKTSFAVDDVQNYSGYTKEELIEKARAVRDDFGAQLGVVFSDITEKEESSERFITVAVADEEGTSTMQIFAQNNERDEDFITACADKALLSLYDYRKLSSIGKEDEIITKDDKLLKKKLFAIASGAVGASAVISFIIALIMK